MRIQLLAVSALLTIATAQTLTAELPCATACIASAVSAAGCAPNDQACQCGPRQSAVGNYAATCLFSACPGSELGSVINIGSSLCAQYSAGLTGSMTTAGMATSGPASTSAVSTTVVVVVSSSSSSAGSVATVVSTVSSTATSASGAGSAAGSASGTSSAAATSASKAAAAGGMVVNGMGGLAAAFLGVIAAL